MRVMRAPPSPQQLRFTRHAHCGAPPSPRGLSSSGADKKRVRCRRRTQALPRAVLEEVDTMNAWATEEPALAMYMATRSCSIRCARPRANFGSRCIAYRSSASSAACLV
jgi:hypothetical protein